MVSDDWLDPCPVGVVMTRLTCSFLAGVLCPAAAGSCSGWFWGDVVSAAFPFSFSLFSCGCLASESAPDSVVMVIMLESGRGGEKGENWMSQLTCYEVMYGCFFSPYVMISSCSDVDAEMRVLFDSRIKTEINVSGLDALKCQ